MTLLTLDKNGKTYIDIEVIHPIPVLTRCEAKLLHDAGMVGALNLLEIDGFDWDREFDCLEFMKKIGKIIKYPSSIMVKMNGS